ncbi:MAG: rRNA (cytidine-2'-O-)-methyltransferase, partial [Pseudomonadota bacterium]|nr:rRNA (cytidine-2'-O-)-methyltransferase [Pseudomonadota bacterium]
LTKKFEEIRRGSLSDLAAHYLASPPKGEIVVLIGAGKREDISEKFVIDALRSELDAGLSVRDAAAAVSENTGWPRRKVYQLALDLSRG